MSKTNLYNAAIYLWLSKEDGDVAEGSKLTSNSIAVERLKARKIYLEAQQYAIGYYAKEGFEVVSEPFLEDGIPHVKMEKIL